MTTMRIAGVHRPATLLWWAALVALALLLLAPTLARATSVPTLGEAGNYTVFSLTGTAATITGGAGVAGTGAVGPSGSLNLNGGSYITGTVTRDPTATVTGFGGTIITSSLSSAVSDALNASAAYAAMTATQVFGDLTASQLIVGTGGVNVISINSILYNTGDTLTLSGSLNDIFIINVPNLGSGDTGQVKLTGSSSVTVAGGVIPEHVLFNIQGTNNSSQAGVDINGSIVGTYLIPGRSLDLSSSGTLVGAVIAGGQTLKIAGGGIVDYAPFNPGPVPAPPSVLLLGLGGIGLAALAAHARRRAGAVLPRE